MRGFFNTSKPWTSSKFKGSNHEDFGVQNHESSGVLKDAELTFGSEIGQTTGKFLEIGELFSVCLNLCADVFVGKM